MIEIAEIRQKVCAYVGRKAMMADRSLFIESFTSLRVDLYWKKKVRGSAWAWFDVRGRQGKLHQTD